MQLLLPAMALACNLYDAAKPDTVFLCADQKCMTDGTGSNECQSGCCHEGKCNNDGVCVKRGFLLSLVGIVVIFLVGLACYFAYWYFRCRSKDPKNNLRFVEGADERPLADGSDGEDEIAGVEASNKRQSNAPNQGRPYRSGDGTSSSREQ